MGESESSSPWRKKRRLIAVMSVATFSSVLLTNSFSDASRAAEDPCADRPFKRWGIELMQLFETSYDSGIAAVHEALWMKRVQRRSLQIVEEKLPKVNPCAYRLIKESQTVTGHGVVPSSGCLQSSKCDDDDNKCAEYVLEQMVGLFHCYVENNL